MSDSTKYTTLHPQGQSTRPKWQTALLFIGGVIALSWVYTTFVPSSAPEPQFLAKKVRVCLLRSSSWSPCILVLDSSWLKLLSSVHDVVTE